MLLVLGSVRRQWTAVLGIRIVLTSRKAGWALIELRRCSGDSVVVNRDLLVGRWGGVAASGCVGLACVRRDWAARNS